MIIDAHHHFWKYNLEEFGWIPDSWKTIRRDFLPADLETEIRNAGVDGVISVQARQTLDETRWLLELAEEHDFIQGVVGWVPLASPSLRDELDLLVQNRKLRGVRHIVQGESDPEFLLRPAFEEGIRALNGYGLSYDILILEHQLEQTIRFVDRHPGQFFIVDHVAKPKIAEGLLEPWSRLLRELGQRDNVACKLSGMVTEADPKNWTPASLAPYFEVALEAFGPQRLLYGTDWPVCLAGVPYKQWLATVQAALENLSESEKAAIFAGNAKKFYLL
jgi:L-fuconolactonase